MKRAAVLLALMVAAVPAADAREPAPNCAPHPVVGKRAKPGGRCRRLGHATRPVPGTPPPMIAAGTQPSGPATPPAGDGAPPAPPAPDSGPVTQAPPARLGVTAREWSLVLSRSALPAGPALVELQNFGEDAHNLRIERVDGSEAPLDVPLAEAGEVKQGQATLTPGDYKIYCTLPGHDAQGMHARLTVN
jgi:hypothetical protein